MFSSNEELSSFAEDDIHLLALKNRCHELHLTAPIFENEPSECDKLKMKGKPYLVRPRLDINGIAILGLIGKYHPLGVPLYNGEPFQTPE